MKYGLENEFFVGSCRLASLTNPHGLIGPLPNDLTPDECGFLAEARGQPCSNIREAVFSLKADEYRLAGAASKLNFLLIKEPLLAVPREIILASRKVFGKGTLNYQNMYGYAEHRNKNKKTAGIHISFTNPQKMVNEKGNTHVVNEIFDYVQIFRKLDNAFKEEIKAAGRYPGFYELKADGRIEYRSLPNNADLMKIIEVLEKK